MRVLLLTTLVMVCGIGCCLLAGCGGGGSSESGAFKLTVDFPPARGGEMQPAVIYEDTNSITIDIVNPATGENVVPRVILNRPSAEGGTVTTTISAIPSGTWTVIVRGFSEADGGGKMLSQITDTVTIETGQTATKTLVMEGYPVTIILSATANPVLVDQVATLTATPKAADGATLLGNFTYEWSSSAAAVADFNGAAGTGDTQAFKGLTRGSCTLQATLVHENAEPNQEAVTGTLAFTVNPNVDEVIVTPQTMELASGASGNATAEAMYRGATVSDIEFTFASSKTAVATVAKTASNKCRVTAVAGGVATITVSQPYTAVTGKVEVTCPEGSLDLIIQ